jgi:hypothetical protein
MPGMWGKRCWKVKDGSRAGNAGRREDAATRRRGTARRAFHHLVVCGGAAQFADGGKQAGPHFLRRLFGSRVREVSPFPASSFCRTAFHPIGDGRLRESAGLGLALGFKDHPHLCARDPGDAARHAQGMALVGRGFQPADLCCEVFSLRVSSVCERPAFSRSAAIFRRPLTHS